MTEINGLIHAISVIGLPPPEPHQLEAAINKDRPFKWSTNGKKSDRAGFCFVRQIDRILVASFGCMRSGLRENWSSKTRNDMSEVDWQTHIQRREELSKQLQEDVDFKASEAAIRAQTRWENARPADDSHPYLLAKKVSCHGLRVEGENLLIPCYQFGDEPGSHTISTLQTISPSGEKLFMPGGAKKGGFYEITNKAAPKDRLILCEGFATGASIFAATGISAAVCFDAGNLLSVASTIRTKFADLEIIIAADDDHLTNGNPGLAKARAAALAVGGLLAVPSFPAGRPDKATDFNDLHQIAGVDAVKACIADAIESIAIGAGSERATGLIDTWSEPTPLPNGLPPVDRFDAALLPVALRGWVMDIAHRMQCPADFPAVAALVALSSLIGARAVVRPKARDDWQVVPNLWGAVVGRPGVKKSPALSEALKPLHRLQANEFELHKAAHEAWALDCKVLAMQSDANDKKAKGLAGKDPAAARALLEPVDTPTEPMARRFIVNDATVEKLGELMKQNPWGILSYRDELSGMLTNLDKQGQEGSRTFYLQSYDGNQGYTFDRIGRGEVHIPRVCLAMIGGIQPGRIQEYVRGAVAGGSADDGLLQRFGLAVWPDVTGDFVHVDQWPDTPAKQTAWAVFDRLAELQSANDTDPHIWRFSPEAQAVFVEWLVPFETEIRGDDLHPAMVSHLSKYRKLIPALALVFALIDTPDSGGVIHEGELLRALAWGEYLRTHANRLYAAAVIPETTDALTLLSRIKAGKATDRDGMILDSFTPRQIAAKGWAGLGTPDAVRKAAEVLADYDYLRRDVLVGGASGGRPSDRYSINPMARGAV